MNDQLILLRDQLVREGRWHLRQPRRYIEFTGYREADELLNDLENYPHAFVIACIMDRQIKAEKAWRIPYELRRRVGFLAIERLGQLTIHDLKYFLEHPAPLHRFNTMMAENLFYAVQRITNQYEGDASAIWRGSPSSATIVRRFLEFRGVGQKIATMAANILVRDFHISVSDHYSIDISVEDGFCTQEFHRGLHYFQSKGIAPRVPWNI